MSLQSVRRFPESWSVIRRGADGIAFPLGSPFVISSSDNELLCPLR